MKYLIKYCNMTSDSMFAVPSLTSEEIVEAKSEEDLDKYITSKKDRYGHPFKKDKSYGFDYISKTGGVKIEKYNPKIKKI